MERYGIKGYDVLLTGDKKIPIDDPEEKKVKEVSELRLINKTTYNELILSQEKAV